MRRRLPGVARRRRGQRPGDDDRPPRLHRPRRGPRRPGGRAARARVKLVRYADRADLLAVRQETLSRRAFPEYLNHNVPGARFWGRLYDEHPDFQTRTARRRRARRGAALRPGRLGRERRRPARRLGRRVHAGVRVRSAGGGALCAGDRRAAGSSGPPALQHRTGRDARRRPRSRPARAGRAGPPDTESRAIH